MQQGRPPVEGSLGRDPSQRADERGRSLAADELPQAYGQTMALVREKAAELDELRRRLAGMGSDAGVSSENPSDEAFVDDLYERYKSNPVEAIAFMIGQARSEMEEAFNVNLHRALENQNYVSRRLKECREDPELANLKPYWDDIEFLVTERGIQPWEVAEMVSRITGRNDESAQARSAAAKEIRNRAAVEHEGEVGEPLDRDTDFDRALRNAKTLDEMFARVRKLRG